MDDSINMTHTAHSECVNGVEIVAEETTPRHLSGGDKPKEGMPDMFVGASYAGAAAIAGGRGGRRGGRRSETDLVKSTSSHT